jgi:monovalent cation:H+ antiporter-2, CPA2 family
MSESFLYQAVVYLAAALVCVPFAKKLGMGSVLGYLFAGVLIGPFVLGFIGQEGEDIMHAAEFGVVMMLFLVGLELEPSAFWKMKNRILGVGLSQVLITSSVICGIGIMLGLTWQSALAVSLALAMSSTAIVIQTLKEKGLMNAESGKSSFAVLLFQDIAVIPILALLPLLAVSSPETSHGSHGGGIADLPAWLQTLAVLGAVGVIILVGNYLVSPFLRMIAKTHIRELFTAAALLLVVGIAALMQTVGLSPALGTFLAGVVLANSEFKHELESDIDPFKGLLLGLFFIAVGASINFELIGNETLTIISLTIGVLITKALILTSIGVFSKLKTDQNLIFLVGLSQVGEFAFVLFSFMNQTQILEPHLVELMMAVTAISMATTPIFFLILEKLILPRFGTKETDNKPADEIDQQHKIIIAGFSHFGSTIGRFLRANGIEATILDNDSDRVDLLRKMGFKVYYGDATRVDLLHSAGADQATILISAIDDPEITLHLVEVMNKHFPHVELMIRTPHRFTGYELMEMGVENVYRDSLDTSIRLGVDVLKKLGFRSYTATRSGQNFLKYDETAFKQLFEFRKDQKNYIVRVREQIEEQEQLLQNDLQVNPTTGDHAWDSDHMRNVVNAK